MTSFGNIESSVILSRHVQLMNWSQVSRFPTTILPDSGSTKPNLKGLSQPEICPIIPYEHGNIKHIGLVILYTGARARVTGPQQVYILR